jgi:drug/metabolite transporter (DMT)-like permease
MLLKILIYARDHNRLVRGIFFGALMALVAVNFLIVPREPHFGLEKIPGFWAVFGAAVAVLFVIVLKKAVFHVIGKSEDFYERH